MRVFALFLSSALALSAGFVSQTALAAKEVRFKEFPLEIAKGEKLVIQGVRGSVRLVPLAAGKTPVIRSSKRLPDGARSSGQDKFDSISFALRKDANVVYVEERGPASRQDFIDWSKPGMPELLLEIEAPAVPVEVTLHTGTVTAAGWKEQVVVNLQSGNARFTDGDGGLKLAILRGDIKVDKQKGNVEIESHAAKVAVNTLDGDLRLHNFSGDNQVANVKGQVRVRSKAGPVTLSKVEGGLDFDNGRGVLNGSAIEGAIRGATDDGSVSLQLVGEADVVVESQDAPVSIKPPAGGGVLLKLSSDEGGIVVPDSVTAPRGAGPKSVVARLEGGNKGTIVVRSKRGSIRVRQ